MWRDALNFYFVLISTVYFIFLSPNVPFESQLVMWVLTWKLFLFLCLKKNLILRYLYTYTIYTFSFFFFIPFHSVSFRSIPFRSVSFSYIQFRFIPFRSTPFQSILYHSQSRMESEGVNKAFEIVVYCANF